MYDLSTTIWVAWVYTEGTRYMLDAFLIRHVLLMRKQGRHNILYRTVLQSRSGDHDDKRGKWYIF